MPRKCKICHHEERAAIERDILNGDPGRVVANRYESLSQAAVQRHMENHMAKALAKTREVTELSDADRLRNELEEVKEDVRRLKAKAEAEGDIKTALLGCDKALKALDLEARVAQIIKEAPTINVLISPEWLELRTVIVQALTSHPEASRDVLRALEGVDDG